MNIEGLLADVTLAETQYRQAEIRRTMEAARAREIRRASRPRRKLFGGRKHRG